MRRTPENRYLQDRESMTNGDAYNETAAGRDPAGVVRTEAENDWRDMIVITQTVPQKTNLSEFCDAIAEDGTLYALAQ